MNAPVSIPSLEAVPRHLAIIMDGNGRWAHAHHLPRTAGHRRGVEALRRVVRACASRGVEVLSVFAFSSENWQRPHQEVASLMALFTDALEREVERLVENGIRLRVIGERSALPVRLRQRVDEAERTTRDLAGMHLVIAVNYGGRWDIAHAARGLAMEVAAGRIDPNCIDEGRLGERLCVADLPEPDLLIRTSGEQRLSNFMLWQTAYTELYFTDALWPDLDEAEIDRALAAFARRRRRFGCTDAVAGRPGVQTVSAL